MIRTEDEVQKAHDVFWEFCHNEKLRAEVARTPRQLEILNRTLDVLCWMLRHDHNENFDRFMGGLMGAAEAGGFKLEEER